MELCLEKGFVRIEKVPEGQLPRVVQGTNLVSEIVDSWIWKNDKIGGYSVKSAYRVF